MHDIITELDSIMLESNKKVVSSSKFSSKKNIKSKALESSEIEEGKKTICLVNNSEKKICTFENNKDGTFSLCCEDFNGNQESCDTFNMREWNKIYKEKLNSGFSRLGHPSSFVE